MDITEFLTACVAEDATEAEAATSGPWHVDQIPHRTNVVVPHEGLDRIGTAGQRMDVPIFTGQTANRGRLQWEADAAHIARHDPARVLREVAAKRRVLARHHAGSDGSCDGCGYDQEQGPWIERLEDCPELRDMASVYADRPGYREEWKP